MNTYINPVIIVTVLLLLQGCGSTPESRFYLLDMAGADQPAAETGNYDGYVGIGPVRFPEYLDRSQLVTRAQNNQLILANTHRWAEPLQDNFTRVLAEHISRELGTSSISIEPSRNRTALAFRIVVDVVRFDADESGNVYLDAYWSIENPDGSQRLPQRRSNIRVSGSRGINYPVIVAGMSEAVLRLAHEITGFLED